MPETTVTPGNYIQYQKVTIGAYTIRLWHPVSGTGMYDKATISAAGRADLWVESVQALGELPAADVTGDGYPDVMFETYAGDSHCCWGTVVYSLGPSPAKVLEINSAAGYEKNTGRGTFQDLDGDGRYEFITRDPLKHIACTGPDVKVVLEYEPGRGYVDASYRFPALYVDDIALYTQRAEQNIESSKTGYHCDVYPVVVSYLYTGQRDKAWAEFDRLYLGPDADEFRQDLTQAVQDGRFFAELP
jgi:hypothetical protein